jgi:hypothetical protein
LVFAYKDFYFLFNKKKILYPPKNTGKYLIILGVIIVTAGIIFTMQSKSIVGPTSSFMYQNPEWTINGYVIIAIGTIIGIFGIILWQIEIRKY